jgi:hypothetical protein
MAFNFAAAEKQALKDTECRKLGLILLGQSGGGKSFAAGTFGVKTLYLYGSGESHGPTAARHSGGGNVVPVLWDYDDEGVKLAPDAAYKRLLDCLRDIESITAAGFKAVMVDGATELEALIRQTKRWEQLCLTDKGKHNNFAEGTAAGTMFRAVLDALRELQRAADVHYAMTCILDVRQLGADGAILESAPRLTGYQLADSIVPQFPDIVVVGRMLKNEVPGHYFQFLAGVTKSSKDAAGEIKKTVNFHPRIAGKALTDLPAAVPADLGKLAAFKAGTKKAKEPT